MRAVARVEHGSRSLLLCKGLDMLLCGELSYQSLQCAILLFDEDVAWVNSWHGGPGTGIVLVIIAHVPLAH